MEVQYPWVKIILIVMVPMLVALVALPGLPLWILQTGTVLIAGLQALLAYLLKAPDIKSNKKPQ